MKKTLSLVLSLFCLSTTAALKIEAEQCLNINRSIGMDMIDVLVDDLKIPSSELLLEKTQMVLLNEVKIDYSFADYLAKKKIAKGIIKYVPLIELRSTYMDDNARNLIIEFTFFNKQNKKAIFIASALINDYECSVTFNDYLIVKREF